MVKGLKRSSTSQIIREIVNGTTAMEMFSFLKTIKNWVTIFWVYTKIIEIVFQKDTSMPLHMVVLFIAKGRSNPNLNRREVDKQNVTYIQWNIFHSKKERKSYHMLQHGWTFKIMLCEISQSQDNKYCNIPLIWNV